MSEWRVGEHYGIYVYAGDRPVATFHRAEDAAAAVRAINALGGVNFGIRCTCNHAELNRRRGGSRTMKHVSLSQRDGCLVSGCNCEAAS